MRNVLGLLLVLWVLLLVILLTPEAPNGHGFPHPDYQGMERAGPGPERHNAVLVSGWLFGSVVIALLVGLLAAGAGKCRLRAARTWAFVSGALLLEGAFAMLCLTYSESLHGTEIRFVGSFPEATSWLIFGIWLTPVYFIGLYVVFFERWILTPEDLERFERLVARHRQRKEDSG